MDNSITIDEGEQKIKGGKVVIKRRFTLSEEGDYETGTIKYHELFYDIDKTSAIIGEEEMKNGYLLIKETVRDIHNIDFFRYVQNFY